MSRVDSIDRMRARPWMSSVMIPASAPAIGTALTPSAWRAMAIIDVETSSPVASSMSRDCRSGSGEISLAIFSSQLVVSPIAETTTTTLLFSAERAARRAQPSNRSESDSELPPYFCTSMGVMDHLQEVVANRSYPKSICQPTTKMAMSTMAWEIHGGMRLPHLLSDQDQLTPPMNTPSEKMIVGTMEKYAARTRT